MAILFVQGFWNFLIVRCYFNEWVPVVHYHQLLVSRKRVLFWERPKVFTTWANESRCLRNKVLNREEKKWFPSMWLHWHFNDNSWTFLRSTWTKRIPGKFVLSFIVQNVLPNGEVRKLFLNACLKVYAASSGLLSFESCAESWNSWNRTVTLEAMRSATHKNGTRLSKRLVTSNTDRWSFKSENCFEKQRLSMLFAFDRRRNRLFLYFEKP